MAELKVVTDERKDEDKASRVEWLVEGLRNASVSVAKAEVKSGRGLAVIAKITHTTVHVDRVIAGYNEKNNEYTASK